MGLWSAYFFGKIYLAIGGAISLHLLANLVFAAALVVELPRRWMRLARQLAALPAAAALLYYESPLPPLRHLLAQAGKLRDFSLPYLLELAARLLDLRLLAVLAVLAGIAVAVWLLGRKLRLATFVFAGLLLTPLVLRLGASPPPPVAAAAGTAAAQAAVPLPAATPQQLEQELAAFYRAESTRRLRFPAALQSPAPFDVMILHLCSLAWDDMDYAGAREHPFFDGFDLQLRNFNAAASYSGPAAARLLQSGCGQPPEGQLYKPVEPECLLVNGLRNAGFEPQLAMNHDGHFDDFLGLLRERGGLDVPLTGHEGVPVRMHAFDGSPLYGDYEMLAHWWRRRLESPAPQVALYYNSITLHDGNRLDGVGSVSGREGYRARLDRLFGDLQRFVDLVRDSGRPAVIVVVPEHGANLRGDRMQIAGLREIPSPAIALGPAALELVNLPVPASGGSQRVDRPTSLFAIASLLQALVRDNPYAGGAADLPRLAAAVPQTAPLVAENDGIVTLQHGGEYWLRLPDGSWNRYDGR